MPKVVRRPTHAGSWYEDNGPQLATEIQEWIDSVPTEEVTQVKAIISPHAGYRYCGHVMAHAYKHLAADQTTRVFVLGPSHHFFTRRCCLSPADSFATPLGNIEIDSDVYDELRRTGQFDVLDLPSDEAEHSLELQMAYLVHVMGDRPFRLVPIMVGALTPDREAAYGRMLAKYLDDPANVFIVSSDFCHWGTRFSYTFRNASKGPIFESISWLDNLGMSIIEEGDPQAFTDYLKSYGNTICGRHPISVFLNMGKHCRTRLQIKFHSYDQSSKCHSWQDSSVSYAAAVATAVA